MGCQRLPLVGVGLCFILMLQLDLVLSQVEDFKVIFPKRLDNHRQKRDLTTNAEDGHENSASFLLKTFKGKHIKVDVRRNKELISPSFAIRTFKQDGTEVLSKHVPEHCHYQGTIRDEPGSIVVLNTCNGLRGIIDTEDETYHIEPREDYQDSGAHKIYQAKESFADSDCGNSSMDVVHNHNQLKAKRSIFRRALMSSNVDEFYKPFFTTSETRYNELLLVVDNEMYKKYNNDIKTVTDKVITLVNAVDAIYQRINIRIVMSFLEIWTTGDLMTRHDRGGPELESFKNYRNKVLVPKYHHDNAQFLSHKGWSDCAGMAWVNGFCGDNSEGVNAWDFNSIIGPYVTMAHEMGHNFGFSHDADGDHCKCLTPRGCIMGGHKTRVPGFSNCSMIQLKGVNDQCLYNVPTQAMNARCGNGIREGNEECDCGTPEICAAKDPCCQPHDCKLKPSSQCSDLHHSCCAGCLFKKQGTLCRSSETDCDLPEYCTGKSGDCPGNLYLHDGTNCTRANKLIQGNGNYYSVVTRTLSPRITARYVRINPQYWIGAPCLRTELYGCDANQVSVTSSTPIKAYNDFCLIPASYTCNQVDGSKPFFKKGYECKETSIEFILNANGILRHHCSGKKVCPEGTFDGAKIVLSSTCTDQQATFVRTPGKSLKHTATGKCIHPSGGWPGENVELVLWTGCDEERLQFWFMKADCVLPLGMQSNAINNSQIIASSYKGKDYPYNARLKNSSYWCPKENKQSEYLQIDLGKVQTITAFATQGQGSWYNWVTGYYVHYSQDGKTWKGYSESGAPMLNSYCYNGKCQETHDKQCKDLWGPTGERASEDCYNKLNTEGQGYGTCDPATNSSCLAAHVLCGQIQCKSSLDKPAVIDYGWSYEKISLTSGEQCSAATLKRMDSEGRGMVMAGTKCGNQKMCKDYKCQSLSTTVCPKVNNVECAGRGVCNNNKVCHCNDGYDPATACNTALQAVNGGFSVWTAWSECTRGCNGGIQSRNRFCNDPTPLHGGADCTGDRMITRACNTDVCPVASSCRHLQTIGQETNKTYPDGVYQIFPDLTSGISLNAYCDMSRDGGGWTLLVASHTNTWTTDNVNLRNAASPDLYKDYSILSHADTIKDNVNVEGLSLEYRLEAQSFGRWGGIWKTGRSYSFISTNDEQTNVEMIKKFDNWEYGDWSIEERMPWLNGEQLTTSKKGTANWGTITDNEVNYHPAPWISGNLMEKQPAYIWYWMREGPTKLPASCSELQMRGLATNPLKEGAVYVIKPKGKYPVPVICDFTSDGGGWTLIATSKTHSGWTTSNVKERNTALPSLDKDYSIIDWADAIKNNDKSQEFFQYRIEAEGTNQYGGVFDAPTSYSFVSTSNTQTNIKLVKNYNNIATSSNLASRMPRLGLSSNIFLSSAQSTSDTSGSIIYNDGPAVYLPNTKPTPSVVRYWVREGTRRTCNDIKVHGVREGLIYQDGYYMIRLVNKHQYFPVFCDMTSDAGAFTLIVTSRHNNWTRSQVPERNVFRPSLDNDYSILKYADLIKNIGNAASFKFKLDAGQRGHWGGVWKAPHAYSFMADNNKQTDIIEVNKFGNWNYSWWNSLNLRMPWYNTNEKSTKALLTTSVDVDYYPSGSIIWGHDDRQPADWISQVGMQNPGVIWYWVNEDDCDTNRQPVNGGLSEWSVWSACDKMCAPGKQKRQKTCSSPKPICGGTQCGGTASIIEEKSCNVCPESPIKTYNGLCVQPNVASCNQTEGNYLVFKAGDDDCSQLYQNFLLDNNGVIHHKCSGFVVCPEGDNPYYGHALVLSKTCKQEISRHQRLSTMILQNLNNGFCVHPSGGSPMDGVKLVYWSGCDDVNRLKLNFFKLGQPS